MTLWVPRKTGEIWVRNKVRIVIFIIVFYVRTLIWSNEFAFLSIYHIFKVLLAKRVLVIMIRMKIVIMILIMMRIMWDTWTMRGRGQPKEQTWPCQWNVVLSIWVWKLIWRWRHKYKWGIFKWGNSQSTKKQFSCSQFSRE